MTTNIIDNRVFDYVQIKRSTTDAEKQRKANYLDERNGQNARQKARELEEIGATPQQIKSETFKALNVAKNEGYQPLTINDITSIHNDLAELNKIDELLNTDEIDYEIFAMDTLDIDYDSTTKDIANYLTQLDFRDIFGLKIEKNTKVPCVIIDGNEGFYAQDDYTGHYRYFSRNPLTNVTQGFDIFDMVSILTNLSYPHNIKWLCDKIGLHYKGGDWMALQDHKYIQNLDYISHIQDNKRDKKYSTFFKFTKTYLPILKEMQILGLRANVNENNQVDNESIYFASLSYIANGMGGKQDRTMISRAINIFCLLGLVKKVKEQDVPDYLKIRAKQAAGAMGAYNNITFYSLPVYDDILIAKATDIINRLKSEKVMVKTFSYKNCLKLFGQDITDKVFVASKDKKMEKEGVKSEVQVNDNLIALPF